MAFDPLQQQKKAEDAIKKGNYSAGIELLLSNLSMKPDFLSSRELLRETAKKQAQKVPLTSGQSFGNKFKSYMLLCKMYFLKMSKKFDQILDQGERLLILNPQCVAAQKLMGMASVELGLSNTAIYIYQTLSDQCPEDTGVLKELGRLHEDTDPHKALDIYNAVKKLDPNDRDITKAIKDVNAQIVNKDLGKSSKSQQENTVSTTTDVEGALKKTQREELVRTEDQLAVRLKTIEEEISQNPKSARLWKEYGQNLERVPDWEKAKSAYEKAIEIDPSNFEYNVAIGDMEIKKIAGQIKELRDKLKTEPNAVGLKDKIVALEKDKFMLELKEYESRVKAYPTEMAPKETLGKLYFKANKIDNAIELFQIVKKDSVRFADACFYLGRCYQKKDDSDLAIRSFEDALDKLEIMNPTKKEVVYRLAETYEGLGELQKALDYYTEIYQTDIKFRDVAKKREELRDQIKALENK